MTVTYRPCGGTFPDPCEGLAPTITGLNPSDYVGPGDTLHVTGTNLDTVTEVVVAGAAYAAFTILTPTTLDVTIPAAASLPPLPINSASVSVTNPCGQATDAIDINDVGLDLPPPSGDIVDIDAQWDALIHNPLPTALSGLTFRLTVSGQPVLTSDLHVTATGLTMTGTQVGDDGVWVSSPFSIPSGGDFALHVTITHDDDSTLSGTLDLLGELLSASNVVLGSNTGTLTIEV